MAALEKLNLSGNELWGAIPSQIANCTELRELNLGNNFFTGFIPPDIGNCSLLTVPVFLVLFRLNWVLFLVLLEMVSGKPPAVEEDDQEFVHLTAWAARMTNEGKMDEIIDKDLRSGQSNMKDEIVKMMEIATFCTRSAPRLRPSMNVVLDMLTSSNRDQGIDH